MASRPTGGAVNVTLIPKPGAADGTLASSYRPISVECVAWRLICAAIQAKCKPWLDAMINEEQRAFVHGVGDEGEASPRSIFDGIAEVLGAAHCAKRDHLPLALVFFDFFKAYDTISRECIVGTLRALGCTADFVRDITFVLADGVSQIVINNHVGEEFAIRTGVSQAVRCRVSSTSRPVSANSRRWARRRRHRWIHAAAASRNVASRCEAAQHRAWCAISLSTTSWLRGVRGGREACFATLATFASGTGQRCNESATRIVQIGVGLGGGARIVPASRQHLLLSGDAAIRLLGVYVAADGSVHRDTWERRLSLIATLSREARYAVRNARSALSGDGGAGVCSADVALPGVGGRDTGRHCESGGELDGAVHLRRETAAAVGRDDLGGHGRWRTDEARWCRSACATN